MDLRLDGKAAIITGGSRGIGKQIATTFAEAGANVMITSRKADVCEEAADEIGHGCRWEAGNVGNFDDADRVIDATLDAFGRADILVNNAATNPYAGPLLAIDVDRWEKTVETNLTAPLFWTQKIWQRWQEENGGRVINLSSVGGLETSPILGSYDITKSALLHLTKQLAAEMGPGVTVNAICPGLVKTDFARVLWEGERGDKVADSYPLKRLGEPIDIAAAALYLAAESGSWMTGQVLVLDGGGTVAFPRSAKAMAGW